VLEGSVKEQLCSGEGSYQSGEGESCVSGEGGYISGEGAIRVVVEL
jgi:hypothetical protein